MLTKMSTGQFKNFIKIIKEKKFFMFDFYIL